MSEAGQDGISARVQTRGGFRALVQSASLWVVAGEGAGHLIRLGSNLVLTRLLFPEAFGLMAIVQAFNVGLEMLSDFGVGPSVVQNQRGEDEDFLNTAWSIQATRGFALWGISLLACWPLGILYGEPQLTALLACSSFSAVLGGLGSMSIFVLRRRMQIGKLTAVEVGSRTWGVAITIVLALMFESVWVLVAGGLLGALSKLVVTHSIAESPRHRFRWDPAASGSIYRFGRWILASTPFAYVINHGDRMILGGFLTMEELGYFAIGSLLAKAVVETSNTISTRVLFPLYSQIGRHTDDTLRRRVAMIRLMLMGLFLPPLWLLTVWGDGVVRLLYDARYEDAGWIAQITAAGMILPIIGRVGPVYMARGETWVNFVMAAVPCVGLALGVVVGYFVGGKVGVLIAIAASRSIQYPLQVWIAIRFGLWMPLYDLLGIATTLAVVGGGLLLLHA